MKVTLNPRPDARFGQDLLARRAAANLGLRSLACRNGAYETLPAGTDLIISHNLDLDVDAQFIKRNDGNLPVVGHIHCQFKYYDIAQQRRISAALKKIRVGVVPARFLQHYFAKRFPSVKWRLAYNGIDASRFSIPSDEQRMQFRNEWGISKSKLVAIVGRLENAKGLQIIEEMCKRLSGYDVALFLQYPFDPQMHGNEVPDRLLRYSPNNILLFPDENPGSTTIIPYCDLLVTTSLSEACPLVVIEALTAGVPVIGTKATCFYDELSDIGIPCDSFFFFNLPEGCETKQHRSELTIASSEAGELAQALLSKAEGWPNSGNAARTSLSESVKRSPITEDSMFRSFAQIYNEAIDLH